MGERKMLTLNMVMARPVVQRQLEVGGSSEMDQTEYKVIDLYISIFRIPGQRCSIGQSSSLRAMLTDRYSCDWSETNITNNSGMGMP